MLEQIESIKNRLQCVYKHTQMMPMLLLNLPMYMIPWSKDLLTWFPKSRNRLSTYHSLSSFHIISPNIFPPTPSKKGPVWEFHQLRISFPRVFPQVFAVFPSPTRPHYAVATPLIRWTPRIATLNQPTSRGEVLLRGEDVEVRHHYLDQEASSGVAGYHWYITDITFYMN